MEIIGAIGKLAMITPLIPHNLDTTVKVAARRLLMAGLVYVGARGTRVTIRSESFVTVVPISPVLGQGSKQRIPNVAR